MDTMSKKASKRCTTSCSVKKSVTFPRAGLLRAGQRRRKTGGHVISAVGLAEKPGGIAIPAVGPAEKTGGLTRLAVGPAEKIRRTRHTGSRACRKNRRAHQIGSRACRKDPAGTPGTSCGHAKIAALSMPRPGLLSTAGSGLHDPLFSQMALRHSFRWPWGIFRMAPKVFGWP